MSEPCRCSNCGTEFASSAPHTFDELTDLSFCDAKCFEVWADYNYGQVRSYYARMNVTEME